MTTAIVLSSTRSLFVPLVLRLLHCRRQLKQKSPFLSLFSFDMKCSDKTSGLGPVQCAASIACSQFHFRVCKHWGRMRQRLHIVFHVAMQQRLYIGCWLDGAIGASVHRSIFRSWCVFHPYAISYRSPYVACAVCMVLCLMYSSYWEKKERRKERRKRLWRMRSGNAVGELMRCMKLSKRFAFLFSFSSYKKKYLLLGWGR